MILRLELPEAILFIWRSITCINPQSPGPKGILLAVVLAKEVAQIEAFDSKFTRAGGTLTATAGRRIRLTQRAYAYWERHPVALRPDQLLSLAQALNVSVDDLVGTKGAQKRGTGPTGKMKQLSEAASRLPRSQQQKLAAIIEPFIADHAGR